jgi:hypothetical protein
MLHSGRDRTCHGLHRRRDRQGTATPWTATRNCDRTLLEALFVPVARVSWWLPEPLATTLPLADDASGMNVAVSIWSDITSDGDHTTLSPGFRRSSPQSGRERLQFVSRLTLADQGAAPDPGLLTQRLGPFEPVCRTVPSAREFRRHHLTGTFRAGIVIPPDSA